MSSNANLTDVRNATKRYNDAVEQVMNELDQTSKAIASYAKGIRVPGEEEDENADDIDCLANQLMSVKAEMADQQLQTSLRGEVDHSFTPDYNQYCKWTKPKDLKTMFKDETELIARIKNCTKLYKKMEEAAKNLQLVEYSAGLQVKSRQLPRGDHLVAGFQLDSAGKPFAKDFNLNSNESVFDVTSAYKSLLAQKIATVLSLSQAETTQSTAADGAIFSQLANSIRDIASSFRVLESSIMDTEHLSQGGEEENGFRIEGKIQSLNICFPTGDHFRPMDNKAEHHPLPGFTVIAGSKANPTEIVERSENGKDNMAKRILYERVMKVRRDAPQDSSRIVDLPYSCTSTADQMEEVAALISVGASDNSMPISASGGTSKRSLSVDSDTEGGISKRPSTC